MEAFHLQTRLSAQRHGVPRSLFIAVWIVQQLSFCSQRLEFLYLMPSATSTRHCLVVCPRVDNRPFRGQKGCSIPVLLNENP